MRRVWDAFLFCNELDLLEARLVELDSAVYRHVLVEAPVTFQGNPKPLHFAENKERFAPWEDKIIHIVADPGDCADHWAREHAIRDAVPQGLHELADDDIFMYGDVDEFPYPGVIQHAMGTILVAWQHSLAVNLLEPTTAAGPMVVHGTDSPHALRQFFVRQQGDDRPFMRNPQGFPITGARHFSWLGGPGSLQAKVRAFSHPEYTEQVDASAGDMYRNRVSPYSGNLLQEVVIDETFPRYMQDHKGPASWYWGKCP